MNKGRKLSGIRQGCQAPPGLKIQKCANGVWGVLSNTGRVVARLLKAQDLDGLKALLALVVLVAAAFAEAAQMAA